MDKLHKENSIGLFKLNFDCLVHLVSFLSLVDMANLEKISTKFKPVTSQWLWVIDFHAIEELLKKATILENLSFLNNYHMSGSFISKVKNLVSLNLRNTLVYPKYFTDFCINNTNLVQLNIIDCRNLTLQSINDITTNLLNLEELSLSDSR